MSWLIHQVCFHFALTQVAFIDTAQILTLTNFLCCALICAQNICVFFIAFAWSHSLLWIYLFIFYLDFFPLSFVLTNPSTMNPWGDALTAESFSVTKLYL